MLINRVDKNKSKLSALYLIQAKRTRVPQRRIWRPTTHDYIHHVGMNMIPNCSVATQGIKNAEFDWALI